MTLPGSSCPGGNAALYLRSGAFFLAMSTSTIVIALIMVLAFPLPFKVRYVIAQVWVSLILWLLKAICGIDHHVEGCENIPSRNAIIFSKHQSAWETIALQKIFPPQVFIIKRELLWLPFFGWALATCEPIAIDRKAGKAALRQVVDQGMRRLKQGRWVVIFPEGTRVKPGRVGHYGAGGSVLAHRSRYPVVPVAHNAGQFWPRNGFLKYPGTVKVRIGEPISPENRSANEINQAAQDWIERQMAEIGDRV
ncbi:MAG: lysophospholipid acyltransferase family protein [Methylococcales bacterium]